MTRAARICVALLVLTAGASAARAQGQTSRSSSGGPRGAANGAAAPAHLPLYASRQSVFAIPFTIDRRVAQPVEVHLYVSVDQGQAWKLYARQPPNTREFSFRASGDGEFWFASRTIDATHRTDSQTRPQPELRVVVDTVLPQIEFAARPSEDGEVTTTWQVFDQNLAASSFKIEYQEGISAPWKPVSIAPPQDGAARTQYQGKTTWRPETRSATINVRAEVRDQAGNLAVVNRRLLLPATVARQSTGSAGTYALSSDPFARQGQPSAGAVTWPSDNRVGAAAPGAGWVPPAQPGTSVGGSMASTHDSVLPAAPVQPGHDVRVPDSGRPAGYIATQQAPAQLPAPGPGQSPQAPASGTQVPAAPPVAASPVPPSAPNHPLPGRAAADSQGSLVSSVSPPEASAGDGQRLLPPGEHPHMTNSTRFQLEYDVDAVGPSGVAEVQLWATTDGGRAWRLWGTDDDLQSPFDVAVEEEGIFGFQVVVVGRSGMSGRRPRTGDPADIWVGVDTTAPTATLTAAAYGEGSDTGKLIIQWQAGDRNLDQRPVTVSFSESSQGPWTIIASALPNTGRFDWPADPELPRSVYLQLEVRDAAGNVTADRTAEPVQLDGLAPQARIRGVQPMPAIDREAFRLPRRS